MLLGQFLAERRQPRALALVADGNDGLRGEHPQTRKCLAAAIARRPDCVFGEAHHPAVGCFRLEAKSMRGRGGNENGSGRGTRQLRQVERHLAAAAFDQQDLKQVAMAVRMDRPAVDRRARRDGFHVNKIERGIVRRIAVKMKQRERAGRARTDHGTSISRSGDGRSRCASLHDAVHKKRRQPGVIPGCRRREGKPLAVHSVLAAALLAALAGLVLATLLLTGLVLTALLLLARLVLAALLRITLILLVALRIVLLVRHWTLRDFEGL